MRGKIEDLQSERRELLQVQESSGTDLTKVRLVTTGC